MHTLDTLAPIDARLEPVCSMYLEFGPVPSVPTPTGTRMLFSVVRGVVDGPRLSGELLPGSADWLSVGDDLIGRVDVRAVVRTHDGAVVQMTTTGRAALGEHAARFLAGEEVTAEDAYIRTAPLFETKDPRYDHLNRLVTVGYCDIALSHIRYRIYAVR